MERKRIQGQEFIIEKYNLKSHEIQIIGQISDIDDNDIQFVSKRPDKFKPNLATFTCYLNVDEYIADIKFIYDFLNNSEINDDEIFNAFLLICKKHIHEQGRLIDNDLFAYIDETIIVRYYLLMKFNDAEMSYEESQALWLHLFELAKANFIDHIYITKYKIGNPFQHEPYLVKLTE